MLGSAIDELKDGSVVTLACSHRETSLDWIEFGVIDNGLGNSDEIEERPCELFFSREKGGSGIGLAGIQWAAELHDGVVVLSGAEPSQYAAHKGRRYKKLGGSVIPGEKCGLAGVKK